MKSTYLTKVGKNYWQYQGIYFLVFAIMSTISSLTTLSLIASKPQIMSFVLVSIVSMFLSCHIIARGIYKFAEKRNNGIFKNILWLLLNSLICGSCYFLVDMSYLFSPKTLSKPYYDLYFDSEVMYIWFGKDITF